MHRTACSDGVLAFNQQDYLTTFVSLTVTLRGLTILPTCTEAYLPRTIYRVNRTELAADQITFYLQRNVSQQPGTQNSRVGLTLPPRLSAESKLRNLFRMKARATDEIDGVAASIERNFRNKNS
jgi:hypothetical protein